MVSRISTSSVPLASYIRAYNLCSSLSICPSVPAGRSLAINNGSTPAAPSFPRTHTHTQPHASKHTVHLLSYNNISSLSSFLFGLLWNCLLNRSATLHSLHVHKFKSCCFHSFDLNTKRKKSKGGSLCVQCTRQSSLSILFSFFLPPSLSLYPVHSLKWFPHSADFFSSPAHPFLL